MEIRILGKPHEVKDFFRPVSDHLVLHLHSRKMQSAGGKVGGELPVSRDHEIFKNAYFRHYLNILECADYAVEDDVVDAFLRKVDGLSLGSPEQKCAGCGLVKLGDAVENSGLAGAVGADETEYLALTHIEAEIVHGLYPAEIHLQSAYMEGHPIIQHRLAPAVLYGAESLLGGAEFFAESLDTFVIFSPDGRFFSVRFMNSRLFACPYALLRNFGSAVFFRIFFFAVGKRPQICLAFFFYGRKALLMHITEMGKLTVGEGAPHKRRITQKLTVDSVFLRCAGSENGIIYFCSVQ